MAMAESSTLDGSNIRDGSNEGGVVNNSMSVETGEVPAVDGDNLPSVTEAAETVEQEIPKDGIVGREPSSLMSSQEEVGKIEKMETQLAAKPSDESEDRLLNDIDQLLAEEETTEQVSEPNDSVGATCGDEVVGESEVVMCEEDTATTSKENTATAAAGEGDEGDQLCLYVEETIDEDDPDLEFDRSLSGV